MADPVLTVTGLRKFFTVTRGFPRTRSVTVRALDGISFDVRDGEAFGLVGESGCGKSTAGRAALRLLEPDAGEIIFKGENVVTASKARLREPICTARDPVLAPLLDAPEHQVRCWLRAPPGGGAMKHPPTLAALAAPRGAGQSLGAALRDRHA